MKCTYLGDLKDTHGLQLSAIKDRRSKKTKSFLVGLCYCDTAHDDEIRKVTGRVYEVMNSENESSGGNLMDLNSKAQEEGGSITR